MATVATAPPTQDASECRLLSIAAELRLDIYDFVYAEPTSDKAIDLQEAPSLRPSKALLLVCREINREARDSYKKAYRSFWRTSFFFFNTRECNLSKPASEELMRAIESDIPHITQLELTCPKGEVARYGAGSWSLGRTYYAGSKRFIRLQQLNMMPVRSFGWNGGKNIIFVEKGEEGEELDPACIIKVSMAEVIAEAIDRARRSRD